MNEFSNHLCQLAVFAAADPFQNGLEAFRQPCWSVSNIGASIDAYWDTPGTNGVAASEACPNCRTRNADDLEIVDGYNCGAYVRCSCGHEYTIEDQFSN